MGQEFSHEIHLLSSVYLSPTPLGHQRYDTSKLNLQADAYSRIGRFLSGLSTFNEVRWTSTSFYISLDVEWENCFDEIRYFIQQNFPGATVVEGRLANRMDWLKAASGFSDESLIYLHANDDHALVSSPRDFETEAARLASEPNSELMMVTHFPEVMGILYRKRALWPMSNGSTFPVAYALGTTLVKTRFFRSWWRVGVFHDDEVIYRPDNPVGRSVTFESVATLAPRYELVRHMDGYAHVLCQAPLPPLRNLVTWATWLGRLEGHLSPLQDYSRNYWPAPLMGLSGSGVDLHDTKNVSSFGNALRVSVARLNAQWGLRINIMDINRARLYPSRISTAPFVCGMLVACLQPRNIRNSLDTLLDPIALAWFYCLGKFHPKSRETAQRIYYLGVSRALLAKIKRHR